MKKLFIVLFSFFAFVPMLNAQQPPCMTDYYGLTYSYQHLSQTPPLTSDMSYDVMLGYIILDTVKKNMIYSDLESFFKRQSYNDTIRYIMKYYYKMTDYNPAKMKLTLYHWYENHNGVFAVDMLNMFLQTVRRVSPYSYLDGLLLKSSIIAHISVNDTLRRTDPSAKWAKTAVIVTCNIIDTIKGQLLPSCKDINLFFPAKHDDNQNTLQQQPPCLQFEYRLEWNRLSEVETEEDVEMRVIDDNEIQIWPPTLVDTNGIPWIQKNSEYIVFLNYNLICKDSTYAYLSLSPYLYNSKTCNIYKVVNGYVQDPENELGFGTSVEINNYKNLINQRINQIISFGN